MLAVAAALVAVTRPDLSVYLEGGAVHIGSTTLEHPADNGGLAEGIVYTGAATLLLVDRPDGSVVASGVTFVEGERVTGVCAFGPPSADEIAERCVLHLGLTAVTCHDTLRFDAPGSWQRRCSDGQDLTVAVPSGTGVVPMPFPLGR
jgi:hypothetical protein